MTPVHVSLVVLCGGLVLAWAGIVAFTAVTRSLHDVRRNVLRTVQRVVARRVRRGLASGDVDRLLRTMPLRAVTAFASDTSVDRAAAGAAARYVLARRRGLVIGEAVPAPEGDVWRRISALRILSLGGDGLAVPVLAEAAADARSPRVAAAAVAALGDMADPAAAEALVEALRAGSCARSRVAAQLETSRAATRDQLLPLLDDDLPAVRYWGTKLLSAHALDRDVPVLARLARDDDPGVRAAAADGLGAVGAPGPLLPLAGDRVPFVRAHAVRALARIGGAPAVGAAKSLLRDESWWVRNAAKVALRALGGGPEGALLELLEDSDAFVRNGAAELLQHLGVLDELLDAAYDGDPEGARLLRRVCAAGGDVFTSLALERAAEARRERLTGLLAA